MRVRLFAVGCTLLLPLSAALAGSITPSQLVVFGDSLSDDGNVAILTGGLRPGANYAPGEYTDGPNTTPATAGPFGLWSDQLAPKLGVTLAPELKGGTDYAFAGADTGTNTQPFPLNQQLFVTDQVNAYLKNAGTASSTALYAFWAGANDLADGKSPITAADNIMSNIKTLSGDGGKTFLWLNLPPLGFTPSAIKNNEVAAANAYSAAFDAEYGADVALLQGQGINVIPVDITTLFTKIEADFQAGCTVGPADPFCFANVSQPAQGNAGVNPNTYVFWDGDHPTTAADALVADLAFQDLNAIPEPAGVSLALLGFSMVCFSLRKRRS